MRVAGNLCPDEFIRDRVLPEKEASPGLGLY
jgi:hypothetical protein